MRYATFFMAAVAIAALAFSHVLTAAIPPPFTGSSSGNDACHIEGAAKYVKAVFTHTQADANAIPTTQNVYRLEGPPILLVETASNRQQLITSTVYGPQAIFASSYNGQQPVYTVINSTTVEAVYPIYAGLLNGTIPLTTAKVQEYFTYPFPQSCEMSFIEAIFYIGQK